MALGVLRAMHESGRQVPGEVSVVGFDDIPEAEFFTPPLTTVCQDFGEVGSRGLRLLMRAIEAHASGGQPPPGSLIAPELKARASTAPPAS
jgi:DNA-binding LacI/PurR family transcriptional regulator